MAVKGPHPTQNAVMELERRKEGKKLCPGMVTVCGGV